VILKSFLNLTLKLLGAALADDDGLDGALHATLRGGDEVKSGLALAEGDVNSVSVGKAAVLGSVHTSGVSGLTAELETIGVLDVSVVVANNLPDKRGSFFSKLKKCNMRSKI